MAFTTYGVFYDYNFGPNYWRNVTVKNIASIDSNFTRSQALAGTASAKAAIVQGNI